MAAMLSSEVPGLLKLPVLVSLEALAEDLFLAAGLLLILPMSQRSTVSEM